MNQFLCRGPAGRLSRVSVTAVLLGLAALAHPAWAWATESGYGRVYLANTQNELLRLRSTAEIFEAVAEFGGRSRSVAIRDRTFISGLADGDTLVGIDFRPATGVLYAVGRIGGRGDGSRYTHDLISATTTDVRG